ncbi:MAG: tyrosine-type recombinase/integrase [Armatimonadaceae bacterium]
MYFPYDPMTQPPHNLAATTANPFQQVVFTFLTGRSATTVRAYRRDLEDFRQFTGEGTVQGAAERLLTGGAGQANALALQYRAYLLDRGLQPATVNRRLAALRSLVKLARLFGLVVWELETPNVRHEAYRDTRGPGKDAVRQMLEQAAQGDSPRDRRDRAILHLLYDLGLRRGEVVALDIGDVELAQSRIRVRGKGRREKTPLSLPTPTLVAMTDWLAVRGNEPGPLFTNFDRARKGDGRLSADHVYRIVRKAGEQIGVKTRPHGLRHTAITEACKAAQGAGIGLEEVLDFSRHKSVQVLMLYRDRERNVQGQLAALVAQQARSTDASEADPLTDESAS